MSKVQDLTGKIFGKLIVVKTYSVKGIGTCLCRCECGNETITRSSSLKKGRTTSCGCSINQAHILKYKKTNPTATTREILKERLKAHTIQNGECLEWTATTSNGYGTFVLDGRVINASRAAWIAEYGKISKDKLVLHHCDNRKCCRIDHLFLGTHKDNTEDMRRKKRDRWETCRKFPVGTREKVGKLRESGKKYIEISKELNLTMDQVKSLLQNYKKDRKKITLSSKVQI